MFRKITTFTARQSRFTFHQVKSFEEFSKLTEKPSKPYVINFHASWCGPCKLMSPLLIKKEKESNGKWNLLRVDIDEQENSEICAKYQLVGVPTVIYVNKDGKQIQKQVGASDETKIQKSLDAII